MTSSGRRRLCIERWGGAMNIRGARLLRAIGFPNPWYPASPRPYCSTLRQVEPLGSFAMVREGW
jgi:hypothetical protein